MRGGLRILGPETVLWLRRATRAGNQSRAALGCGVCEPENWRNRNARHSGTSACTALPKLDTELGMPFPAMQPGPLACRRTLKSPGPTNRFASSPRVLGEVWRGLASPLAPRSLAFHDCRRPLQYPRSQQFQSFAVDTRQAPDRGEYGREADEGERLHTSLASE